MLTLKALGETPSNLPDLLLPESAEVLARFSIPDPLSYIRDGGIAAWAGDKLLFIIGLVKTGSLLGLNNELWMLGGKGLKDLSRREWKFLRAVFRAELKNRGPMTARVPFEHKQGHSFAKLFGLSPTYRSGGFQYYEVF